MDLLQRYGFFIVVAGSVVCYTNSNHHTVNPDIVGSSNEVLLDSMFTVGYFSCTGNEINGWLHYVCIQQPLATCTSAPPAGYVTRHTPVHN